MDSGRTRSVCRLREEGGNRYRRAMSVLRDFPDLPPVWMLGHAALAWVASTIVPLVSFGGTGTRMIGGALALVGIALSVWAAAWFARRRTTIEPRETPTRLIVEGPFRLNRNPIYTGMALVLAGWALWLGTLSAVLAVLPFTFVITNRFIRGEEAALRDAFGFEADAYLDRSRRW